MGIGKYVFMAIVFIILLVIISNIKVVPHAYAYVVERLGAYHETWSTVFILQYLF